MERRVTTSRMRVRYKDTDQMGIAHHANHIVWFEIGRTDLCREAAVSYREIESRGYLLVVTEVGCRYRTPFHYDDEVVLLTRIGSLSRRSIRFEYELRGPAEVTHGTGFSSHLWLDRETRRPVVAPEDLLKSFESWRAQ
jgi:acyl-CoA thioester hydrolase